MQIVRLCSIAVVALILAVNTLPLSHAHASSQGYSETATMPTLWLEEMTWTEIQGALRFGYTNILIPSAGIMQNGPHLPLYKHRLIIRKNAEAIARRLGNTLIAPIIDFVPAGNIEAREGHMSFAGTISMPGKVFADIIEYTVRSLHKNGFSQFFLIGDSGGAQPIQTQIEKTLQKQGLSVLHIEDYYALAAQIEGLRKHSIDASDIGGHAGLRDTSEFMLVAPDEVRDYQLGLIPQDSLYQYGAWGNTSLASKKLGKYLAQIKVDMAIAQICRNANPKPNKCRR
jgi:creatinine amidohydrolase/Fe(II)-dependent formamide hydrolase-like protein